MKSYYCKFVCIASCSKLVVDRDLNYVKNDLIHSTDLTDPTWRYLPNILIRHH